MPFYYKVFGERPKSGRSLFISLHGGGGAPKEVNDKQWANQQRLYQPAEGVYLAPRAPTNTWNLWHQAHIDKLLGRLIENLVAFEDVDPNRVYLLGYSAGGDGVYQLAPRMADRFAAAAMMAGHPNDASPLGLRNLAFTVHVGGRDEAYNRNRVAAEWQKKLEDLRKADPEGYVHWVKIYADKGHWLDREDAAALPWMAKFTRDPIPRRVVWRQASTTHARFYWLAVSDKDQKAGAEVAASYSRQQIDIDAKGVSRLIVRLNDRMLDLDQPLTIATGGKALWSKPVSRTIGVIAKTLAERGDPAAVFCGEVAIDLGAPAP
jgi:predicted esterase